MAHILIIDDDRNFSDTLADMVSDGGHSTVQAGNIAQGIEYLRTERADLIFLDVGLPDGDGIAAIPEILRQNGPCPVIVITGAGDTQDVERALNSGAWDYLLKPLRLREIDIVLSRALASRRSHPEGLPDAHDTGILGSSPGVRESLSRLDNAATTDANVLIHGETGVGKELFARALHSRSLRRNGPFIVVDCASLPETLAASMLFGHERGAFTGAVSARSGLIQQAEGGTLFLDEVGEMGLALQKMFLRVLQERSFTPVGSNKVVQCSFRLVSATNRDLEAMAEAGEFRQDLLYRLRSIEIGVPPLRDRREDIPILVDHFAEKAAQRFGMDTPKFSPECMDSLTSYGWPGNVRELAGTVDAALAEARESSEIYPQHLPTAVRIPVIQGRIGPGETEDRDTERPALHGVGGLPQPNMPVNYATYRKQALDRAERIYLNALLDHTGGSRKEACRVSGLGRTRLYTLLKKHDIP